VVAASVDEEEILSFDKAINKHLFLGRSEWRRRVTKSFAIRVAPSRPAGRVIG
jgi:hypothetical protein